jgi:hypothetical protein
MSPLAYALQNIRTRRRLIGRDLFPFESGPELSDHARELNRQRSMDRIAEIRAMVVRRRLVA